MLKQVIDHNNATTHWNLGMFLKSEVGKVELETEPDFIRFVGTYDDEASCRWDLYIFAWFGQPDRTLAVALNAQNGGVWEFQHEPVETVSEESVELLQKAVENAEECGFLDKLEQIFDDLRRAEGTLRDKLTTKTFNRSHKMEAIYLENWTSKSGVVFQLYIVPREPPDASIGDISPGFRAFAYALSEGGGTRWREEGTTPHGAAEEHMALREAIRRAFQDELKFEFKTSDMIKYNDHDGVNFPDDYLPSNENREYRSAGTETKSMTTTTEAKKKFTHVTISRSVDEQIHLPEGMSYREGRQWLDTIEKAEEQMINWSETIDAYPLDGALALNRVLEARFGSAIKAGATKMTWFGEKEIPPFMVAIETGIDTVEYVPWGYFIVPVMPDQKIKAGIEFKNKQLYFSLTGEIKRKHKPLMDQIAAQVKEEIKVGSIYKGKAFRISFPPDDEEDFNPHEFAPKFINVARPSDKLILSKAVEDQIITNLLTPIRHSEMCRKHGIPLKRGILLAGKYGTGKTLTASITSKECVDNGWTFIYVSSVSDLEKAMRFARRYEPCVIFAEDIDSVMQQVSGSDRDAAMNMILNTIDGVDMKRAEQITVLTSNFLERINKAMLRPGRLDAVISVDPPDAETVTKLIRHYSGSLLAKESDDALRPAAELLAGQIPSVIREATERAKLTAIGRCAPQGVEIDLRGSDLLVSAQGIINHAKLLEEPAADRRSDIEKAADRVAKALEGSSKNGASSKLQQPAQNLPGVSGS